MNASDYGTSPEQYRALGYHEADNQAGLTSWEVRYAWCQVDRQLQRAIQARAILRSTPADCRCDLTVCGQARPNVATDDTTQPHWRAPGRHPSDCRCGRKWDLLRLCDHRQQRALAQVDLTRWADSLAQARQSERTWLQLPMGQRTAILARTSSRDGNGRPVGSLHVRGGPLGDEGPSRPRRIGPARALAGLLSAGLVQQAADIVDSGRKQGSKDLDRRASWRASQAGPRAKDRAAAILRAHRDIPNQDRDSQPDEHADLAHTCGPRDAGETWATWGARNGRACPACQAGQMRIVPEQVPVDSGPAADCSAPIIPGSRSGGVNGTGYRYRALGTGTGGRGMAKDGASARQRPDAASLPAGLESLSQVAGEDSGPLGQRAGQVRSDLLQTQGPARARQERTWATYQAGLSLVQQAGADLCEDSGPAEDRDLGSGPGFW